MPKKINLSQRIVDFAIVNGPLTAFEIQKRIQRVSTRTVLPHTVRARLYEAAQDGVLNRKNNKYGVAVFW